MCQSRGYILSVSLLKIHPLRFKKTRPIKDPNVEKINFRLGLAIAVGRGAKGAKPEFHTELKTMTNLASIQASIGKKLLTKSKRRM